MFYRQLWRTCMDTHDAQLPGNDSQAIRKKVVAAVTDADKEWGKGNREAAQATLCGELVALLAEAVSRVEYWEATHGRRS